MVDRIFFPPCGFLRSEDLGPPSRFPHPPSRRSPTSAVAVSGQRAISLLVASGSMIDETTKYAVATKTSPCRKSPSTTSFSVPVVRKRSQLSPSCSPSLSGCSQDWVASAVSSQLVTPISIQIFARPYGRIHTSNEINPLPYIAMQFHALRRVHD